MHGRKAPRHFCRLKLAIVRDYYTQVNRTVLVPAGRWGESSTRKMFKVNKLTDYANNSVD